MKTESKFNRRVSASLEMPKSCRTCIHHNRSTDCVLLLEGICTELIRYEPISEEHWAEIVESRKYLP